MKVLKVQYSKSKGWGSGYTVMTDAVTSLGQAEGLSGRMGVLILMLDLQDAFTLAEFDEAREGKETWDWWGNDEYVRGEGDLVHVASSPNTMDVERNFLTMTKFQLNSIIHDLYGFMETGKPVDGAYAEDGTRRPIDRPQD